MLLHLVLFRPRTDLSDEERQELLAAFERARREIPAIRRVRLGRRIIHGRGYEERMAEDYAFAAILEFDDLAGLEAYLDHPAHDALGRRFGASVEAGLVYDYAIED